MKRLSVLAVCRQDCGLCLSAFDTAGFMREFRA
jgi:hypothetical protein